MGSSRDGVIEPAWLDLNRAADYASLSVRTLRGYIGHPTHPLPARRVGGKWIVAREALDRWLESFPAAGEDVDRLVDDIVGGIKGGKVSSSA